MHLFATVTPIAYVVGNPRHVDLEQQIERWTTQDRCRFDECRAPTEIVVAVYDRAEQIGVLNQQSGCASNDRVFTRRLTKCDRAVIAKVEWTIERRRVFAHKLGHTQYAVVRRELCGECCFANGLGAGENYAGEVRSYDRFHSR